MVNTNRPRGKIGIGQNENRADRLVATLTESNKTINFTYNTEEQRGRAQYYTGPTLTRTRYYAENYERTITPAGTQQISYVMAEGKPVAMFVTNGLTGPSDIKYIGTDHLGSITEILNTTSSLDEQRSYDAWGRMRNPSDWSNTGIVASVYDRGYTGQELLKDFNVINLNGRLYDPLIGRMFSVDPYITDPDNAQTYNIYSYCSNNPLKYTDKDGEWALADDLAAMAIGGIANVISQGMSGGIQSLADAGAYFAIGAAGGAATIYGGPLAGGAIIGAGNSAYSQYAANGRNAKKIDGGQVLVDGLVSSASSYFGSFVGGAIAPYANNLFRGIHNPFVNKVVTNTVSSGAMGYLFGFGGGVLAGEDLSGANRAGLHGGAIGLASGFVTSSVQGYMEYRKGGAAAVNRFTSGTGEGDDAGTSTTIDGKPDAVQDAAKSVKEWLGEGYRIDNPAGDPVFMSNDGTRKFRLDFNNPHGDVPHMHLQKLNEHGNWKDAVPGKHRLYPKK